MSTYSNLVKRPSDRSLFLTAAVAFPLLVLIAYFKTYYFRAFFDVKPLASAIVHLHGVVMSLWVVFFSAQIALVRTKNIRLHMTLGIFGAALAVPIVVTGFMAAYNAHLVRLGAPPGIHPYAFFIVPFGDLVLFLIFLGGAHYFRRRPVEHKALMLMTAINFLPPALGRVRVVPAELNILWSWGIPDLLALGVLAYLSLKHRRFNKTIAVAVFLLIASQPLRFVASKSAIWMDFAAWLASFQ